MKLKYILAVLAIAVSVTRASAQVPGIIQYQGRVTVGGTNFTGTGLFKFAIIETTVLGTAVWSSSALSGMGEPKHEVPLPVGDGLFIVGLGDTALTNMAPLPAAIFNYGDLHLRVWFSDGVSPFVALTPDQRIASVGFAMMAANVSDGAITSAKLADGAVTASKLGSNSVSSAELSDTVSLRRIDMLYGNNSTGAVLTTQSSEARLHFYSLAGNEVMRLGHSFSAGEMKLYLSNGVAGIEMDAAETPTTGGRLVLRDAGGNATATLDAEAASTGGGRLDLRRDDNVSTVEVLADAPDATLAGGGILRIGPVLGENLALDGNEILARNTGAAAPLYLNYQNGAVVYTRALTVGTTVPAAGYALSVNGKVICEELVVQDSANWPDYVFAKDYKLRSLEEVEASIQENKHLPGIPSARKIGEDGVPLGQIQKQMMEKIEELTLYVIEQNKRLKAQEGELQALRTRVETRK